MTDEPGEAVQSNNELEAIRVEIGAIVTRLDLLIAGGETQLLDVSEDANS